MQNNKTFVVIAAENLASSLIVRPLFTQHAKNIGAVFLVPNLPVESGKSRLRALKLIWRASWFFTFFKLVEIYAHNFLAKRKRLTVKQLSEDSGVKVFEFSSVKTPEFIETLRSFAPDYILSAGPAILTKSVLSIPKHGTLNCHGARLPEYQGAANYIWCLLDRAEYAFTTIQKMELKLDAGPVYAELPIKIDPEWSAYRLNYEVSKLGGELYSQTVAKILEGNELSTITRPDALASNRGIPEPRDIKKFRNTGHKLLRLKDIFECV